MSRYLFRQCRYEGVLGDLWGNGFVERFPVLFSPPQRSIDVCRMQSFEFRVHELKPTCEGQDGSIDKYSDI